MKKISVNLAIERPNREGLCSIYVRVTIDRRKKDFPTGKKVPLKFWDAEKRTLRVSSGLPNAQLIKATIEKRKNEFEAIITQLELQGKAVCFDTIANFRETGSNKLFWKYCEDHTQSRLDSGQLSPNTANSYFVCIGHLKAYSPNIQTCDLTGDWLEGFQNFLLARCSSRSTRNYLKPVNKWVNDAMRNRDLERNPFDRIDLVKSENHEREFLSLEELTQLDALYWSDYSGKEKGSRSFKAEKRVLEMFLVGCYSGLRKSDILALLWDHIKINSKGMGKYFQIKQVKTKTTVKIPLTPKLEALLDTFPRNGFLVFPEKVANQTIARKLKVLCQKIGVSKEITFHCSRHTFATACLTMGMPLEVVSKLCGHTDIATTKIYARLIDERIFDEMEKFDLDGYSKRRLRKVK
ncbi:MAG: site-specific integrase [Bacteroidia bacterium]|nr:site-specific integrase [Bacteroidia bacterium]